MHALYHASSHFIIKGINDFIALSKFLGASEVLQAVLAFMLAKKICAIIQNLTTQNPQTPKKDKYEISAKKQR